MRLDLLFATTLFPLLWSSAAFAQSLGAQTTPAAQSGTSVVDATGAVIGNYSGLSTAGYGADAITANTVTLSSNGQWIQVQAETSGFINANGFQENFESTNCTGQAYLWSGYLATLCTASPAISKITTFYLPKITVYCPSKPAKTVTIKSSKNSDDPTHACYPFTSPYTGLVGALTPVTLSYKAPFALK